VKTRRRLKFRDSAPFHYPFPRRTKMFPGEERGRGITRHPRLSRLFYAKTASKQPLSLRSHRENLPFVPFGIAA